jgi:hypothetical protein
MIAFESRVTVVHEKREKRKDENSLAYARSAKYIFACKLHADAGLTITCLGKYTSNVLSEHTFVTSLKRRNRVSTFFNTPYKH